MHYSPKEHQIGTNSTAHSWTEHWYALWWKFPKINEEVLDNNKITRRIQAYSSSTTDNTSQRLYRFDIPKKRTNWLSTCAERSAAVNISPAVMLFVSTGWVSSMLRYQLTNPLFPATEEPVATPAPTVGGMGREGKSENRVGASLGFDRAPLVRTNDLDCCSW